MSVINSKNNSEIETGEKSKGHPMVNATMRGLRSLGQTMYQTPISLASIILKNHGILSTLTSAPGATMQYVSSQLDTFMGSLERIDYDDALNNTKIASFVGNNYKEKYNSIEIMSKDDVANAIAKEKTLCVSSGMGGHAGAFLNIKIKDSIYCGKIISPKDTRELEFYKFMNDNVDKPFYGTFNQFIPQLHGIIAVKNNKNINKFLGAQLKYNYYYCIALDNMKKDIKDPVFIDIKIGAYTAKNSGRVKTGFHKIINEKQSFSRAVGSRVEGYSSPRNLQRDRRPDITPGYLVGSYISRQNIFQEKYIKKFEKDTYLEEKIKDVFTFLENQNLNFLNKYIKSFLFENVQEKSVLSTSIHLPNEKKTFKDRIKRANPFLLLNISLEDIYPQNNEINNNIKKSIQNAINQKKLTTEQQEKAIYKPGKLDKDNSIKIKILNDIELGLFNIIKDYILPNYNSFINGGACFSFTGSSVGIIFTGNANSAKAENANSAKAIVKLFDFGHPETYGTGFPRDKNNNKRNIMGWAINDYSYGIINLYIMVYFNLLIYNKNNILTEYEDHVSKNKELKNTYDSYFINIKNPKIKVLYRLILKPMADKINDNSFIRFKNVLNILFYMNAMYTNYPSIVEQIYTQNYNLNNLRKNNLVRNNPVMESKMKLINNINKMKKLTEEEKVKLKSKVELWTNKDLNKFLKASNNEKNKILNN